MSSEVNDSYETELADLTSQVWRLFLKHTRIAAYMA